MATFTGNVPDHILRNYLAIGKTATILAGSKCRVHQEPQVIDESTPNGVTPDSVSRFHDVVCRHCGRVNKIKFKPNGAYVEDRAGSRWHITPSDEQGETFDYEMMGEKTVKVVNLLPGYDDVYAPHAVHNAQVVWMEDGEYHMTDINNTAEVVDGKN